MRNFTLSIVTMIAMVLAGSLHMELHAQVQQQQQQQQEEQETIVGILVEMEEEEFVIRTDDGRELTFEKGPQLAQAEDLQDRFERGSRVQVEYHAGAQSDQHIATSINPVGAGQVGQQQDAQRQQDQQRQQDVQRQQEQRQQDAQRQQEQRQQDQQRMGQEQEAERIAGTVTQKEDDSFSIRTDDGRTMTFQTESDVGQLAEEERDRHERQQEELREALDEVEEGERVTVHYRAGMTPTQHVAVKVEKDGAQPGAAQQPYQQQQRQQDQQRQPYQQDRQQAQEGEEVTGTITQKEDDSFAVRTDDGRTMTFRVEEGGQLRVEEEEEELRQHEELQRSLEELEEGDRVTVQYRHGATPTEHIAVKVEEARPGMGQQAQQRQQDQWQQDEEQEDWQQERQQEQQRQQMGQEQEDSISGTILQKEEDSFTLRTDDGRSMTFRTRDESALAGQQQQQEEQRQEELQENLDEFEEGDRVTVRYRAGATPTEHIAVAINEARGTPGIGQQQDEAQQFAAQQDRAVQQQDPQQDLQQDPQQDQLPATSSMLPLVAGMGLLTLLAALGLGVVARRQN